MKIQLFTTLFCIIILVGCKKKTEPQSKVITYPSSMCTPVLTDSEWYSDDHKAPLIPGLDVHHYPITTDTPLAQTYFNQGLILAYGFNHAEAARSFYYASRLDSTCAMTQWGYAYVLGPNYNAGMEEDNYQRAFSAIQKATQLAARNGTQKEKRLIAALSKRYVKDPVDDRYPLDIAYADAMEALFHTYSDDADIGTLYIESLMNLHPWDLWDFEGNAKEWTPKIIETFDRVLELSPKHPGAHHFYIHAVEASSTPERGLYSAQLYDEGLVPGAGHLVHMPAHIYIRTGHYHKGTLSNLRAVQVDSLYVTTCHAQGTYPLTLYPHNYHFMAATATLEGNSEIAIMAANKVSDQANRHLMKEPGWGTIQHFYTIPYYVLVKLGKWEEILEMQNEDPSLIYPAAVRHYARGMAYIGLGDIPNAQSEQEKLEKLAADQSLTEVTIWDINSVYDLVQIAHHVLHAEIKASEGNFISSIDLLIKAVEMEDALNYQEPPDWFFSVRHHLGSVQIEAGKYEDGIATLKKDLSIYPNNGWALHGLQKAYTLLNDLDKMNEVNQQLDSAWAYADIDLSNARIK